MIFSSIPGLTRFEVFEQFPSNFQIWNYKYSFHKYILFKFPTNYIIYNETYGGLIEELKFLMAKGTTHARRRMTELLVSSINDIVPQRVWNSRNV